MRFNWEKYKDKLLAISELFEEGGFLGPEVDVVEEFIAESESTEYGGG